MSLLVLFKQINNTGLASEWLRGQVLCPSGRKAILVMHAAWRDLGTVATMSAQWRGFLVDQDMQRSSTQLTEKLMQICLWEKSTCPIILLTRKRFTQFSIASTFSRTWSRINSSARLCAAVEARAARSDMALKYTSRRSPSAWPNEKMDSSEGTSSWKGSRRRAL